VAKRQEVAIVNTTGFAGGIDLMNALIMGAWAPSGRTRPCIQDYPLQE
jgi:hypothetical protein